MCENIRAGGRDKHEYVYVPAMARDFFLVSGHVV